MSNPVGFTKLAAVPRLTGAALGAGAGFIAAPEDDGLTGAAVGGALGYGAGALASRFAGPAKPPVAAVPAAGAEPRHTPAELAAAHAEIERHLANPPLPQAPVVAPQPGSAGPPGVSDPARAKTLAKLVAPARQRPVALPTSFRKVGFEKLSDFSAGSGVGPLSIGMSSKDERLEGMNRWVPRATLEQAYQGLEQGLDQQALLEEAAASGNIQHPAIGAGLAAALAHFGLPGPMGGSGTGLSGPSKALAALAGGGAGALYNQMTAGRRMSDMSEAIKGVQNERHKAQHHTAREAMPLVVSSASKGD